jgi:mannosylglycoprotein endo-beta-mannosidase
MYVIMTLIIHHSQYGFIAGRDISHNILNVQLAIEFAKETNQEMVMLQLDLEKTYDHVDWSFVYQLMHHMGNGNHMSKLIYTLVETFVSHVMLNGGE